MASLSLCIPHYGVRDIIPCCNCIQEMSERLKFTWSPFSRELWVPGLSKVAPWQHMSFQALIYLFPNKKAKIHASGLVISQPLWCASWFDFIWNEQLSRLNKRQTCENWLMEREKGGRERVETGSVAEWNVIIFHYDFKFKYKLSKRYRDEIGRDQVCPW